MNASGLTLSDYGSNADSASRDTETDTVDWARYPLYEAESPDELALN